MPDNLLLAMHFVPLRVQAKGSPGRHRGNQPPPPHPFTLTHFVV